MGIVDPAQILNQLRENIITALKQRGLRDESKDGMDIALCAFNRKTKMLSFAGANNPLYILRKVNGEYKVIDRRGDTMPIGIHERMDDFAKHELEVLSVDSIYLITDGIIDQFGGPDGRKFMRKRLLQMFMDHQGLSMPEQQAAYLKILEDWISQTSEKRPNVEQTDDITILGIKI
jgi:serine phosphatase RsbU (regulator of sigma subunit)